MVIIRGEKWLAYCKSKPLVNYHNSWLKCRILPRAKKWGQKTLSKNCKKNPLYINFFKIQPKMTSWKPLKEKSCFQWNYYIGKYNREYHLSCECAIYSKLISVADVKIRMRVLTCTTYINNIGPYLIFYSGFFLTSIRMQTQ